MYRLAVIVAVIVTALPTVAQPQSLPVQTFTAKDGLIHDSVAGVSFDAHGFLWVATVAGLSRFDGQRFTNYSPTDGLPDPVVNDVLDDRLGRIWVATNGGGIARFDEELTRAPFVRIAVGDSRRTNRVNRLLETPDGWMWAASDAGLFRARTDSENPTFEPAALPHLSFGENASAIPDMTLDGSDGLWLGTAVGPVWRDRTGRSVRFTLRDSPSLGPARLVVLTSQGLLWTAHHAGLVVWRPPRHHQLPAEGPFTVDAVSCARPDGALALPTKDGTACILGPAHGLAPGMITALAVASDGSVIAGTNTGGLSLIDSTSVRQLQQGSGMYAITGVVEDRQRNIWMATTAGVQRIVRRGIESWRQTTQATALLVMSVQEDPAGSIYATGYRGWIHRITGTSAEATRPLIIEEAVDATLMYQGALIDRFGGWWVSTGQGLYRFGRVPFNDLRAATPQAIYQRKDGLPSDLIGRLFQDRHGDLWMSTLGPGGEVLARWQRATGRIQSFSSAHGLPVGNVPMAFAEDRDGRLWIVFRDGGVGYFHGGRYSAIEDPLTQDVVFQSVFVDRAGRLWLGTRGRGAVQVDDPLRLPWRGHAYSSQTGLVNDTVFCFAEAPEGALYVGGNRGVDRIDVATGAIEQITQADGLAAMEVLGAHTDRSGQVWFATSGGVSRLNPSATRVHAPARVYIGSMRVAGTPWPISRLGVEDAGVVEATVPENRFEVEFFGLDEGLDGSLKYQTQLEGTGDSSWSAPNNHRSVTYASLSPGRYRFLVRAVNKAGQTSARPATVTFVIHPPFWQRRWFIAAAGLVLIGLGYSAYRHRIRQLLAVERVRTSIAADLHDDIGSNLSKVTLLSEVLQREATTATAPVHARLASISSIAQESIEAMADIVWAVDPTKDRVGDLVQRMRHFVEEAFAVAGVAFTFDAPADHISIPISPEIRRAMLLVFKEGINNIVRHADAATVRIAIIIVRGQLVLTLEDDGRGFDAGRTSEGNGLRNMTRRAGALGGTLDVTSSPGRGTRLVLSVPAK